LAAIRRDRGRRALHVHRRDSGLSLIGTVLGAEDGLPVRIEYRVLTDADGMTSGGARS